MDICEAWNDASADEFIESIAESLYDIYHIVTIAANTDYNEILPYLEGGCPLFDDYDTEEGRSHYYSQTEKWWYGCVAPEHFRTVLPHLDRILFDVKHTDGQKLKETVGADADTVGENLRLAARAGIPVVLRSPLVAGFNLTEEHLRALGALARSLPAVERVELLPYHRLGEDKRRRLGLSCVEFREPTEAEKKFALAAVRREYPNAEVL